jgi:hypothetical protein
MASLLCPSAALTLRSSQFLQQCLGLLQVGGVKVLGELVEQLVLEIGEGIFVEGKLPLEGPVGHPAAPLQHGDGSVKNLFKGHRPPSIGQ